MTNDNDHGGTRLTAVEAVSVSASDQLSHAAPEMYEALKAMLTLTPDPIGGIKDKQARLLANAAIAKAEGRPGC